MDSINRNLTFSYWEEDAQITFARGGDDDSFAKFRVNDTFSRLKNRL
jgi:hypothetical protein